MNRSCFDKHDSDPWQVINWIKNWSVKTNENYKLFIKPRLVKCMRS